MLVDLVAVLEDCGHRGCFSVATPLTLPSTFRTPHLALGFQNPHIPLVTRRARRSKVRCGSEGWRGGGVVLSGSWGHFPNPVLRSRLS